VAHVPADDQPPANAAELVGALGREATRREARERMARWEAQQAVMATSTRPFWRSTST